jgi:hypothetical protein
MHGCAFLRPLHTSALILGNSKEQSVAALQCTVGQPTKKVTQFEGHPGLEAWEFSFTTDASIVIWFYNNQLVQVSLKRPADDALGLPFVDYKSQQRDLSIPRGYLVTNNGVKASIIPIYANK